jgi:uncharacterized protein YjdB
MRVVAPNVSFSARPLGALAVLLLGALAGCLDLKATPDACSVTVAPTSLSLAINRSAPIVGTAFDCNGNSIRNKRISYSSSNTAVATVTTEGIVIAVGVGATSVSAVADGKSASSQVTVTPEQAAVVTLNPGTLTLRRTNTRQITATARNSQGIVITGRAFRWASSNSAIVSVDQSGNLSALAPGPAVITAEVDDVIGQAAITVTEIPVGSCSLAPASSKVTISQTVQPTLTLRDTANAVVPPLGRPIAWTSSNEGVATVSQSGLVTTRRAGTATITASPAENPQVSCSTVVEAVDPRIAQVVITPRTGSLRLGIPRGFSATLLDSVNNNITTGRVVSWSTNTPTVVQVTQAGIVTGVSLGTARIIATAEGVADTIALSVTRIPVATVTVTPLQATIFEGASQQFRATVTDSVGTEVTDRTIEWISSDPTRATVSQSGMVTSSAPGVVTITAISESRAGQGGLLVLQVPVDSIQVQSDFTLTRGTERAFAITLVDANGRVLRGRNVLVTSDFPSVATGFANSAATQVSVQGIGVGSATLTLQALNANGQAEGKPSRITVTVTQPTTGGAVRMPPAPSPGTDGDAGDEPGT